MKFLERFFCKKKNRKENKLPPYNPENRLKIRQLLDLIENQIKKENEIINTLASTLGEKSKCQN